MNTGPTGGTMNKGCLIAVFLVLGVLFLGTSLRNQFLIEIPVRVVIGWAIHGFEELPACIGKWREALIPAGCLLMAMVLAHRFLRRWMAENSPQKNWRWSFTACAFALLLLGSAAAISMSGVVHQFFWLKSERLTRTNHRTDLVVAINTGRQLMLALMEYEYERGRYPDSFQELEQGDWGHPVQIRRLWWLDPRNGNTPEPWILLRPGSTSPAPDDLPVILSPMLHESGKAVVGYGNGSVRPIPVGQVAEIMKQAAASKSGTDK